MNRQFIIRGKILDDYTCYVLQDKDTSEWTDNEHSLLVFTDGKPAPTCVEIEMKRHALEDAEHLRLLREQRNKLLQTTDYLVNPDYPHTDEQRNAWIKYRQQLRDLPNTSDSNTTVYWPVQPSI
jgi:hypothetical protein